MCPWGARFVNGSGGWLSSGRIICHVLLIETAEGLVLVDTGFGAQDVRDPRALDRTFAFITRPALQLADTAVEQVRALGHDPGDVRHIVLTHLDIDHAGGLPDFPGAQVHVFDREYQTMLNPPGREKRRYRIASHDWAHGPQWVTHAVQGDEWMGFESVRVLPATDPEILLIPLTGHTLGHTAIAVRRDEGWLLHCGDAYFNHGEVLTPPSCPPGMQAFQNLVQANRKTRLQNQERLRELARRRPDEVELICSHDPTELEAAQSA
jgi:glyoxylase-like metal-dependent hydrolase (beta-lactamase superfamily II)